MFLSSLFIRLQVRFCGRRFLRILDGFWEKIGNLPVLIFTNSAMALRGFCLLERFGGDGDTLEADERNDRLRVILYV